MSTYSLDSEFRSLKQTLTLIFFRSSILFLSSAKHMEETLQKYQLTHNAWGELFSGVGLVVFPRYYYENINE